MSRNEAIAKIQGFYWLAGGLWPIVHMDSFLWVTSPKVELWLVRSVALLLLVIGSILLAAAYKKRITPEIKGLGLGSTAVIAFVDIYYVATGTIPFVYLLDGIAELVLFGLWIWAGKHGLVTKFLPS